MKFNSGILVCISMIICCCVGEAHAEHPTQQEVKSILTKVADWQIETFEHQVPYRAFSSKYVERMQREGKQIPEYHDLVWQNAALYAGMYEWSKIADDPKYVNWLKAIGEKNGWALHKRPYHADDHAVGQFYLNLYRKFEEPAMIAPTRERFDWIMQNPKTGSLLWEGEGNNPHERWGWCDALFMAPPVWARLAAITGEKKYLEFMDREYHETYDLLWNKQDHLFWRDSSYFPRYEANGRNLYWARGNGWVFAGLALMIPDLPQDWDGRKFYVDLYQQMAARLKDIQRSDGTWSMGLLGGEEAYPIRETSGTGFYVFGLTWGINQGILDRTTYEPVVLRGWKALTDSVTSDGLLGYVQPVGAAPGESFPDKTEVYGVGAFLAAGAELYKFVGNPPLESADMQTPITFMEDGGWCWYQDPRAIISNGKLIVAGLNGQNGDVKVSVFDLDSRKPQGTVILHAGFQRDDHDVPALYARPDGSVLAMYARHGNENIHFYRISAPDNPLEWGPEQEFKHDYPNADNVTYINLYSIASENLLINFFRGIDYNPSFIVSRDHGLTWGEPTHFIADVVNGRQRPYARYLQRDKNTIGVSFTEAHPRNFGNSIYYAEFHDGAYFRVNGEKIKNLADGPLTPAEAEQLFKGSGVLTDGRSGRSAPRSAWTSSMAVDRQGHPHVGYTLYLSNDDHRYRIASWDGRQWHDREVAYAGKCLYNTETSYTGLITMDQVDPHTVYISSDVDPSTGSDLGGVHEIYRGTVGIDNDTSNIRWEPVTRGSQHRNIRPVSVSGDGHHVLLWLSGPWKTYTDYETDIVGLILD